MIFLGLRDRSHHLKFLQYENEIVRFYLTKVGKKLKQWKERTATRMKDIKYLHVEREREREREKGREKERQTNWGGRGRKDVSMRVRKRG